MPKPPNCSSGDFGFSEEEEEEPSALGAAAGVDAASSAAGAAAFLIFVLGVVVAFNFFADVDAAARVEPTRDDVRR